MIFKRLYMRNFLSVGSEGVEILFDKYQGTTLITGVNNDVPGSSNGSGKSTIIEGIFYGLTGYTLRKLNAESIVHKSNSKQCRVEIEFDNIKIIRMLEPSEVKVFVNDKEETIKGSSKETKKKIDDLVGVNFETLANILVFGQHNMVSFLDAPEAAKREIIENLMHIKDFNIFEEKAKAKLKDAKNSLKTLVDQFEFKEKNINELNSMLDKHRSELNLFVNTIRREIASIEHQIDEIPDIDELKQEWNEYSESQNKLDELRRKKLSLSDAQGEKIAELNSICEDRERELLNRVPLSEKLNSLMSKSAVLEQRKSELWKTYVTPLVNSVEEEKSKIAQINNQLEIKLAGKKVSTHWEQLIETSSKLGNACPTCFSEIDSKKIQSIIEDLKNQYEEEKSKIQKDRDDLVYVAESEKNAIELKICSLNLEIETITQQQKQEYLAAKEKLSTMINDCNEAIKKFDLSVDTKFNIKMSNVNAALVAIKGNISSIDNMVNQLEFVQEPEIKIEEVGKLQSKLESLSKQKIDKENSISNNPHSDIIESISNSIKEAEKERDAFGLQIRNIEKTLPYLTFWTEHMGKEGIKSYVIDQMIPMLNEQVAYWMDLIYEENISLTFDKYFNVTIINNSTNTPMVFGQGSGGERRRIDLAIMMAFRQVMKMSTFKDPNILFFDECCESLDAQGVKAFGNVLNDIAKHTNCYVISHNFHLLEMAENFNSTLHVEKTNGAMKLVD